MDIKEFEKLPLLGILRGIKEEDVVPLVEAIADSSLKAIEVTMNTPRAAEIIKKTVKAAKNRFSVGAGTVLGKKPLKEALAAGASFIVSPVLVKEVSAYCRKRGVPFFPGAFTPQEIYRAWQKGPAMVKVFPAGFLGPAYFREVKAPLDGVKLLACGGVNAKNISEFFKNGADAVAFGASVFNKDCLARKEFSRIAESIKALIAGYRAVAAKIK